MTISIATSMFPYRMVLSRKKPVELKIDLTSRNEKDAMVTLQVLPSRNLSFDKSGLKTGFVQKIDKIAPNEKKKFTLDIFPKGYVGAGEYDVTIKVSEHFHSYEYVAREYTKNLTVTVEE
ncbi:MAG: hypothetical protein AABW85_04505 [archaeon]